MKPGEWIMRSRRVVTPSGTRPADILIRGEVIEEVGDFEDPGRDGVILDVGSHLVLPGLVDIQVHIQEPGPEEVEGFETATRAAAAGGVTTLVDLPIFDRPATTTSRALAAKLAGSVGKLWVDCGFHGGLVAGGAREVEALLDAGVLSIVATLSPSSGEFPAATANDLHEVMPRLARADRPLIAHAGLEGNRPGDEAGPDDSWTASREVEAIRALIDLCREHGCRVHVLHLSTAEALPWIARARAEGLPLTVDTCPHHLVFTSEEFTGKHGQCRVSPPLRTSSDREGLWEGLKGGLIDGIGSGHLPSATPERRGRAEGFPFPRPGIASLQVALPAVWTEARRRGFSPDHLARWMAEAPARVVGLSGRKGGIVAGSDADLVVLDPEATFIVDPNHLFHRLPSTPYEGRGLSGVVELTILRGRIVHESGRFHGECHGVPILLLDDTLPTATGLDRINKSGDPEARSAFFNCCGSSRWAAGLASLRPFHGEADLIEAADGLWATLERPDRLEAYRAHPRLAGSESRRPRPSPGPGDSPHDLAALAQADLTYEAKFGHPFFAADIDSTAFELLAHLRRRLANEPEVEDDLASVEQAEITRRNLRALIS